MRDEVEELRRTRRSEAGLREEAYQDAISREGENIQDHELRESKSTVEKLTQEIRELQEVPKSYSESQDIKDLKTASSSGSAHAPRMPSVFPSF